MSTIATETESITTSIMYTVKEKRTNTLRKFIIVPSLFSLAAATAVIGYYNYDTFFDTGQLNNKMIEYVLYANTPDSVLLHTFEHPVYGKATLHVGNEADTGLRHILARHTTGYFINYNRKNPKTLFDDQLYGLDILKGLEDFFKHSIKVDVYNRKRRENTTYIGFADMKGVATRCLMAVETQTGKIITFYPLNGIEEKDLPWERRFLD